MKASVIVSANAEWRVVREIFPNLEYKTSPYGEYTRLPHAKHEITLFHGGWGKVSAAASAQYVIDHHQPDLLINLGTCGGFAGRIETGTILLVERTIIYDIIEQMGDAAEATDYYGSTLDLGWLPSILPYPVSRSLLVSADRDIVVEDIPMLIEKYGAVAADWESGPIAWVAQKNRTRILILRAVSDLVGGGGGEAYGNIELFHQRTGEVMKVLFDQLPAWLEAAAG